MKAPPPQKKRKERKQKTVGELNNQTLVTKGNPSGGIQFHMPLGWPRSLRKAVAFFGLQQLPGDGFFQETYGCGSKNRNSKMGYPGKWKHGPKPAVCPSCLTLSHTHNGKKDTHRSMPRWRPLCCLQLRAVDDQRKPKLNPVKVQKIRPTHLHSLPHKRGSHGIPVVTPLPQFHV